MSVDVRIRDCLKELPKLDDASVDSIITDPPYEIAYRKVDWDRTGVTWQPTLWAELLRVLRPGGYLVVVIAPEQYHRAATLAEQSGFRILPHLKWVHDAPSLPKTRRISTLVDARLGVEREIVGSASGPWFPNEIKQPYRDRFIVYRATSKAAQALDGQYLGTGTIRRSGETILLAQRPPQDGDSVATAIRTGVGGIQIEAYRQRYDSWPTTVFKIPRPTRAEIAGCPHPTIKPVDLLRRLVLLFTPKRGTVLDPFAGSGTTGMAAALEGRRSILIERDRAMRGWIKQRVDSASDLVRSASARTSVHRTNTSNLRARLAAARRAVDRLDRVERRLGRIAAPYAARVVVEGVKLHLVGCEKVAQWRALLEQHGIWLRRTAKSPCQGAARLMFERAPTSTVNMYASAMGWAFEKLRQGRAEIDELAELIVQEGGVDAVGKEFARSVGGRGRTFVVTNVAFEAAVAKLTKAGTMIGDAQLETDEMLALVRRDRRGRRTVYVIETDAHRVRAAVLRYGRIRGASDAARPTRANQVQTRP
jgi:site-specific DNA-methyltransferase (adenine-specific)